MRNGKVKEFDYYLFDADGTLFDTTEMIVRCFHTTARVFGLPLPAPEDIIGRVGLPLRKQMECYFGELSDERFQEYRKIHMAYQLEIYRDHLRLCPGVAEALQCLHEHKKACAVVTSRMPETLTVYLREMKILEFFSELITPRATERHKPEPEPALEALRRLGGKPDRAVFIGDSLYDMECGRRAGTATAFVEWSHNKAGSLGMTPDFLLADMRDICAW